MQAYSACLKIDQVKMGRLYAFSENIEAPPFSQE
jgi:hypothetical protein